MLEIQFASDVHVAVCAGAGAGAGTFRRAALGDTYPLGWLYDARTDKFGAGNVLREVAAGVKLSVDNHNIEYKFTASDSASDVSLQCHIPNAVLLHLVRCPTLSL